MKERLTRKDIAEKAGVAPSTVSRALAGRTDLLPEETIAHVQKIATEMGYRKNMLASRFASNKSYQIGFVVPLNRYRGVFQLSYYSTILDAIVSEALPRGYTVSIAPIEDTGDTISDHLQGLIAGRQVDGLVLGGLKQDDPLPDDLERHQIPTVLVGSHYDGTYVGSVNCSPTAAIDELMVKLTDRGYSRIFFVSGDMEYHDAVVQKEALSDAVAKSAIGEVITLEGNYSRRSGYAAAKTIIPEAKDGDCVFLANDRMAMGFYRYCYENGVSIPERIGVIGSDDDEAATALYPDLTTIHQPRQEMGAAAVGLLIDLIEGKQDLDMTVTLAKTLRDRNSLAPAKPSGGK
jgi:LacI family transcriptional regulator